MTDVGEEMGDEFSTHPTSLSVLTTRPTTVSRGNAA